MPPFTYGHFIQAVYSLKEDKLMYYIDEAVGIYCIQRGITVGPRPASSKDYSPQYADAFEAANYAIYIVAGKIGAYNPSKGPFRPYLHTALENALKDILEVDGYGPSASIDIENEPDTTASDAEGRIRRHKDDAYETMIRFIDTLPEIKRAAIYASAFGQILRPDLKGYGRNYADILAGIYHTTALYIRQLATEGKKAALAEVRRQGFSESSMNEAYMGFQQSRAKAKDINDEVLKATEKLDAYQQFRLLRHLAAKVNGNNKDNNGNNNSKKVKTMSVWADMHRISTGEVKRKEDLIGIEYKQENATLTPSQEALLEIIENLPSPFKGISKLADLRRMTGVTVVVSDKASLIKHLEVFIDRINEQIKNDRSDINRGMKVFSQCEEDIYIHRLKWAEDQLKQAMNDNVVSLLGLYTRKLLWFDNARPTVYLFADNIKEHARRKRTDEDNVFGYVFIHEMMHAYYDAFNNEGFPSREPIEEAFAEYGMLTFIKQNIGKLPVDLLDDAKENVRSKINSGPSEYGFGFDLFNLTGGGDPAMIDRYKDISNWIDRDIIRQWPGKNRYFNDIRHYPQSVDAQKCLDGVKEILDFDWPEPEPDFIIQPRIRGSHLTPGPGPKRSPFPVMPRLHGTKEWAVTASKIDWCAQYPLIITKDFVQLMVEVLKVMKSEGFEACLSFAGDKVVFLGRHFSYYSLKDKDAKRYPIPESICVKGLTVFPAFKEPLLGGSAGQVGNILYALGLLLDGTFTLAHEGSSFVLYGPNNCAPLFSIGESTAITKYDIVDKATSTVIGTKRGMSKTVLCVVRDFCSKNPGITLADLQRIFDCIPHHSSSMMSIVESDGRVRAYKTSHPRDKQCRYSEKEPITLANGDVVMVSNQWAATGDKENFSYFKKVAENLGYIIK